MIERPDDPETSMAEANTDERTRENHAENEEAITVTFKRRTTVVHDIGLPDELVVSLSADDVEQFGASLNAALELIYLAPAFDHIDGEELSAALGISHYAEVDVDEEFADISMQQGLVTNTEFNIVEPVTRHNVPFAVGDTVETASGTELTYQDYPTDGLQFENGNGLQIQIETGELAGLTQPDE